ncbi:MAG: SPOR domain-containing protein [Methylobacter sp.]|nr:SPOR domain-containing protein [Methylobacter sp.]
MTDSIDKKLKEKHDNLDDDLDAMLDEAESSLLPMNEFQDDEDAIDRLLMNAGFDTDDAPMQATEGDDVSALEELDDFPDFPDFSDFNEPEMVRQDSPRTAAVEEVDDEPELATGSLSALTDDVVLPDEIDDVDESDMTYEDEVEASAPALAEIEESDVEDDVGTDEELDDFSDFSDFNEPDIIPVEIDESEQDTENLSTHVDAVGLSDEIDDFSSFNDDFDESDMIQDDEVDVPVQAGTDSIASNQEQQAAVEQFSYDEGVVESLLPDAGFDSGNALEQTGGKSDELVDDAGLSDEIDDFSGFGDDFDESDMIQGDEIAVSAPVETDLIASNQEQQAAVEESFNDLQNNENGIDSLLMDSGFNAEDVLEQTVGKKKDEFGDDADLSEIDDFFQLDEVSDDFSRETEEDQLAETEQSIQDEDDFLLPDFDITADIEMSDMGGNSGIKEDELADAFGDTDFLDEDEAVQAFEPEIAGFKSEDDEAIFESQPKQAADAAIDDIENAKMNPLGFEQENIKKQLEDAENKVKKAKLFSYVALGFGAVALSAAAGLGVMVYGAKSEVSKLTEQVSTLEANLAKNAENNPNEEINAVMNSVVQLNQQVYGFITELKETPQFPVDLLNNKVPDIVAKQGMVSKALDMLQVKMGGAEGKMPLKPWVAEPIKVEAVHEHAPVKEENAHEIAPTKERAKHETTPAKVETVPETVPAKAKTQPEAVPAKPITPPKAVFKEEPVKASKQTATAAKWGVNLAAFKQEWFAKSKAAEFARLGVFAEVIPVREKNTTMYRLRVGGFKSKAEAFSNTDRLKETLNLDSVWVSDN